MSSFIKIYFTVCHFVGVSKTHSLMGMDTLFGGGNSGNLFWLPSEKGLTLKGKNLLL